MGAPFTPRILRRATPTLMATGFVLPAEIAAADLAAGGAFWPVWSALPWTPGDED